MSSNIYLEEKVRKAHCQALLHETEKEQLLSQLPRPQRSSIRYAAGKLGVLLLKLGTWLKEFEFTHSALENHQ